MTKISSELGRLKEELFEGEVKDVEGESVITVSIQKLNRLFELIESLTTSTSRYEICVFNDDLQTARELGYESDYELAKVKARRLADTVKSPNYIVICDTETGNREIV